MQIRGVMLSIVCAIAFALGAIALAVVYGNDGYVVRMRPEQADAVRFLVLAQVAFALGQMLQLIADFQGVKVDARDQLTVPLAMFAIWIFTLSMYVALDVADRMGRDGISYKSPLAFVAFGFGIVTLYIFRKRLNGALTRARSSSATAKLTVTDTSKPGPDIDLMGK
jgi:hypothetical protein